MKNSMVKYLKDKLTWNYYTLILFFSWRIVYLIRELYKRSLQIVRDILDILAQCNRPKPTPACTSCLGFNHIYILMLGFIVTQIIVLHSYIIKM